ncbi:MAG: Macrolide export ATP-binding/permease protein MacB [Planctomycetota bacterium]
MIGSVVLQALFLRPLKRGPWRFLSTVVGVAAGVAAVVSTLAASRAALASLVEGVAEVSGVAAWELAPPGGMSAAEAGRQAATADLAVVAPVVEELVVLEGLDDAVRLLGVDPLVDRHVRSLRVEDEDADADGSQEYWTAFQGLLAADGVCLSEPLARRLGLSPGDAVPLVLRSRRHDARLLATFPVPAQASALERVVVADIALVQSWRGDARIDRLEFVPRPGVDAEELRARIDALAPAGAVARRPAERAARTSGMVRSLEFNLTSLSGISLLVGAVLVATTLATSVVQRKATIALLLSLGASRRQLASALLAEAALLGALGGLLGTLAGAQLAQVFLPAMRQTYATVVPGAPRSEIVLHWTDGAIGAALGMGAAFLAAILPLFEILRVPPIQALRAERPSFLSGRGLRLSIGLGAGFWFAAVELMRLPAWRGLPLWALASTLCVLGVMFALQGPLVDGLGRLGRRVAWLPPLRLALASLSAGRRRAAWAAGAVGVATSLSVSIAVMVTSFRQSVVAWTDESLKADLSVRPALVATGVPLGGLDADVERVAVEICGRDAVLPYHVSEGALGDRAIVLAGADFRLGSRRGPLQLVEDGRDERAVLAQAHEHGEVLVNEALHAHTGLGIGDLLHVQVRGRDIARRIAGVVRDYGDSRGTVTLDLPDFLALHPGHSPQQLAIFLDDAAGAQDTRAVLQARLSGTHKVDVLLVKDLRSQVLEVFERTFAITGALQAVSAVVALVAVLVVLHALVAERRKDLALLSAIGASRAQIVGGVCLQAALLGLLGAGTGAVAGLVIGLVLVDVVNLQSFGWTLELVQPWWQVASTMALVAVACVVAALPPSRAATAGRERLVLAEE